MQKVVLHKIFSKILEPTGGILTGLTLSFLLLDPFLKQLVQHGQN